MRVDPQASNFLQALDRNQLAAIRKVLSEHTRWKTQSHAL